MSKKANETNSFEQNIAELEAIVQRLEHGELSLDQALAQFEQGVSLSRQSQQQLQHAEQKVQLLTQTNGQEQLQSFEPLA